MKYEDLSALTADDIKNKALEFLSRRMHSEYEIKEKLCLRGADSSAIDEAIEFLKENNFLDDKSFAQMYAEELFNKKLGKNRIKSELYKKGIDSGIVSEILENSENDEDLLLSLVKNKLCGDFSKKSIDRAVRYFTYRGYSVSEIFSAINKLRDNYHEEDLF